MYILLTIVIICGIPAFAAINGMVLSMLASKDLTFDELYNPVTIYHQYDTMNVLGCSLIMILQHVIFPFYWPFYWVYKLCTAGRR